MQADLPHDGVWARLGVSTIHGIGVFAIRPIPAGTSVFASDDAEILWVESARLDVLPLTPAQRSFYRDFCIHRGDLIGCPANFNLLNVGWYVNEPAAEGEANLVAAHDYALIACRDIAEGEELTVRYDSFSQPASGWREA
jgi:hypothetical protein